MALTKQTVLQVQSGTSYVAIDNILTVSTPNLEVGDVEGTVLTSNAKEFEPGIQDGGSVSFTAKYNDTVFTTLTSLHGTTTGWKVLFSDDNGFGFQGYLKKLSAKSDGPDKLLTLEGEIKVSGEVEPIFAA